MFLHGLVTEFKHQGSAEDGLLCYRAVLRPGLWFLTRTSNCRIFQDMNVPDIIKQVFELNGFHDFIIRTSRVYTPRS
ncbi:contractile injection system protein, VgrG/Pvc8 family [Methylomicrobium lacus]|uniref:contractile injection system protein, VgrG/Pvc8 family n=1 Tax=Methylomicrobium lacus TaxID=136992 RepID=UPI0035A868A0